MINNNRNNVNIEDAFTSMNPELYMTRNNPELFEVHYSTGFSEVDKILDGGLAEGQIHIIGAVSSLGKTTMVMQIVENLASNGVTSLVFSLETSNKILTAKAISRHTYIDTGYDLKKAKAVNQLLNKEEHLNMSNDEWNVVHNSATEVKKISDKIKILEGTIEGITVLDIQKRVSEFISKYNQKPVLVVDYLQILTPVESMSRSTDKQITDYNIKYLTFIARKYKIPVVVISSLNRANYHKEITTDAFKESGGIEYTADVLIGLQYKDINNSNFDLDKAKRTNPRDIELVVLKNRNGQCGEVGFKYYPRYNYFVEENDFYPTSDEENIFNPPNNDYIF